MVGMPKSFCTLTVCPAGARQYALPAGHYPTFYHQGRVVKSRQPNYFIFYVYSRYCLPVLAIMCATGQPENQQMFRQKIEIK